MQYWEYEIGDVLLVNHKGVEQVARVAGYIDSLDNTTPLLVNLRVSNGLRWGERKVRVRPAQIVRALPDWQQQQHEKWEADLKAYSEVAYAKMSPAAKESLHRDCVKLGLSRDTRSPLDIMIDRACGIE